MNMEILLENADYAQKNVNHVIITTKFAQSATREMDLFLIIMVKILENVEVVINYADNVIKIILSVKNANMDMAL